MMKHPPQGYGKRRRAPARAAMRPTAPPGAPERVANPERSGTLGVTMRRSIPALAFVVCIAGPAVTGACGTDDPGVGAAVVPPALPTPPGAEAGDPADSSSDRATIPDAALPRGTGDPCRGIPMPLDQHYVPKGMCARVVAITLNGYRQLTFAPNGDLFAVTAGGSIVRFKDSDDDGFFQESEISIYAEGGGNGNNCHIDASSGYLYAGSPDGVRRWPWGPNAADGGAGEDVVIGEPSSSGHPKHTVHVYDGYLYVHSGSADNTGDSKGPDYDDNRSLIRRFKLSSFVPGSPLAWLTGEIVTSGLRNANGFTKNAAGRMYAVVNGMDGLGYDGVDVHEDNPGEQVVELAPGKRYGFPFCFTAQRLVSGGQVVAPGTQLPVPGQVHDAAWCAANSSRPAAFIQAHSAPLDLTFFDAQPTGGLPERYRGGAFVALHGSWNREPPTGYKVIWIPFDDAGNAPMPTSTAAATTFPYETVFGGGSATGAVDGPWSWATQTHSDEPRFAGVAVSPIDGALYVTADTGFYIYRVGQPN